MTKQQLQKLERKKLELEISKLSRPWYKNPEFLQIVVPLFLGIASLIYAFSSGLIDKQRMDLDITKKNLEYDIQKFTDKKDSLNIVNSSLEKNINNMKTDNIFLTHENTNLKDGIKSKTQELGIINNKLATQEKIKYELGCKLHFETINQKIQSLNGTVFFNGMDYSSKLSDQYDNSVEGKKYSRNLSLKEITDSDIINKEKQVFGYNNNRQKFQLYLIHLRDSIFNKDVKPLMNSCSEYYEISSRVPTIPYVKLNKTKPEGNYVGVRIMDSVSIIISRK